MSEGFSTLRSTTAGASGSLAPKCLYARKTSEATTINSTTFDMAALYLLGANRGYCTPLEAMLILVRERGLAANLFRVHGLDSNHSRLTKPKRRTDDVPCYAG
jgi:hypothetical protein